MMVNRLLRSVNPILEVSIPSTRMRPCVASTKRKKDKASVLFPDPVLPKIPTWCSFPESGLIAYRMLK